MAKFRMVYTEFWNDPKVIEEMTPEDKYFFLYLLTNPNTTQVGIYQITKKQIGFDMGYSMETVNSLLDRFLNHHKIIKYNVKTREIAIRNWGKYNLKRGGKPMIDCVTAELKDVKCKDLIPYVGFGVQNKSIKDIYDTYNLNDDTCNDTSNDTHDETKKNNKPSNDKGSHDTSASRDTYRPQYKEQEQEEEQEEDKEQQQEQEAVSQLMSFWDDNGFGINNINAKQGLLSWLDDSKFKDPVEVILKAMDIACSNNKRRLNYVEGILRNWENESLLTVEEIEEAENNGERIHGRGYGNAGSSGASQSYEQAMRELEASKRAVGR